MCTDIRHKKTINGAPSEPMFGVRALLFATGRRLIRIRELLRRFAAVKGLPLRRLAVAGVLDSQSMRMLALPGTGDIARNGDKRA